MTRPGEPQEYVPAPFPPAPVRDGGVRFAPWVDETNHDWETNRLLKEILAELRKLTAVPDADVSFADPPKQKIVERAYGKSANVPPEVDRSPNPTYQPDVPGTYTSATPMGPQYGKSYGW